MLHFFNLHILCFRQRGHCKRKPQVDPGANMVTHRALPNRTLQIPTEKIDARLVKGMLFLFTWNKINNV